MKNLVTAKSKAIVNQLIPGLSRYPRLSVIIIWVSVVLVVLAVTEVWIVYYNDYVDFDAVSAFLETTRVGRINDSSGEYVVEAGYVLPTPLIDKYRSASIQRYVSDESNLPTTTMTTSCPTVIGAPTSDWVDGPEPQRWQPASADSNDAFVFSAHFDTRWAPDGRVLIIGMATEYEKGGTRRRYCRVWFQGSDRSTAVEADFRFVPETHGKKYAAVLYTCHVTMKTPSRLPYAVSLVDDVCQTNASNLLRVLYNDPAAPPEVDFTVCMSVLHSGFDDHFRLIEAVEANRMFGAERFVIYDHEIGRKVRRTLSGFVSNGVGVVVSWNSFPVKSFHGTVDSIPEIHYFAQVAAINDCLYRNLFRSTFILFADIDELVVPRGSSDTWLEVLESAMARWEDESRYGRFPGVYSVRNAFFRPDVGSECLPETGCPRALLSLTWLDRDEYVWRHGQRSKYFVWSKAAVMVGIHFPYEMMSRDWVATVYLRPDEGLLHHYRVEHGRFANKVSDNRMLRYAAVLLWRISDNS